jgi:hypothetical protein|tara:strand:+ start:827 stop:1147 length:321 start_codon:yes stop_codon:yes gene_type:complete
MQTYKTATIAVSGTTLLTVGAGSHFIHSCYVANVYGSALPITIELVHADTTVTHLAHNLKVMGDSVVDIAKDNKIYIQNGDAIKVKTTSAKTDGFTVTLSLLKEAL